MACLGLTMESFDRSLQVGCRGQPLPLVSELILRLFLALGEVTGSALVISLA